MHVEILLFEGNDVNIIFDEMFSIPRILRFSYFSPPKDDPDFFVYICLWKS